MFNDLTIEVNDTARETYKRAHDFPDSLGVS